MVNLVLVYVCYKVFQQIFIKFVVFECFMYIKCIFMYMQFLVCR